MDTDNLELNDLLKFAKCKQGFLKKYDSVKLDKFNNGCIMFMMASQNPKTINIWVCDEVSQRQYGTSLISLTCFNKIPVLTNICSNGIVYFVIYS